MAGGFVDYSGRRIGSWTILEPVCDPENAHPMSTGAPPGYTGKWAITCACGRRFVRSLWPILNGHSSSCSECQKVRTRKRQQTWNAVDMARHASEKAKRSPARASARAASLSAPIVQPHHEVAIPPPPQKHDTMRSLLMSAVRTWVLAQHLPQRVIADRLQVPRTAVSDIIRSKSNYAAEKLLELWSAVGGQWELRLTLGDSREKDGPPPPRPGGSG